METLKLTGTNVKNTFRQCIMKKSCLSVKEIKKVLLYDDNDEKISGSFRNTELLFDYETSDKQTVGRQKNEKRKQINFPLFKVVKWGC